MVNVHTTIVIKWTVYVFSPLVYLEFASHFRWSMISLDAKPYRYRQLIQSQQAVTKGHHPVHRSTGPEIYGT